MTSSGRVGDLSEEQLNALDSFRSSMEDILRPEHDDYFCLRWLRARKFNVTDAVQMLRTSLQWRKQIGAESLIDDYEPHEVLTKYFPGGLVGHDKEGCPVWIIPFGHMDIKGMFYSVKKSEFIKYVVKLMEISEQDMKDQTEELGKKIETHSIIFDMDNFTMKQVAWKPAVDMMTQLVKVFEDNYPERLKKTYVINAPAFFPMAYAMIKPFLSEETAKKIHVYVKETWKSAVFEDIDPSELPSQWGGTKPDPEDRPLVAMGGQVPASYYTAPSRRLSTDTDLTKITVEKKSVFPVELTVTDVGSTLHWEFQTENYDIGFSVWFRPEGGIAEELVPLQRVNCHLVPEDGMLVCDKPGKYILKFDNSFSWCRRKHILYQVQVTPPSNGKNMSYN
ncbi:SEC14-like protein 2 [Trichonephila clavata]|uniref:SEC14-like protein 2 n=1 Tax=Trichonephila clavata TaxID=2740835 RepID=A0A8X6KJQ5_TRICU|nr:SEC14-like protein 2 [Trichonephila clavata]